MKTKCKEEKRMSRAVKGTLNSLHEVGEYSSQKDNMSNNVENETDTNQVSH